MSVGHLQVIIFLSAVQQELISLASIFYMNEHEYTLKSGKP